MMIAKFLRWFAIFGTFNTAIQIVYYGVGPLLIAFDPSWGEGYTTATRTEDIKWGVISFMLAVIAIFIADRLDGKPMR
jgi:hypothetical protein